MRQRFDWTGVHRRISTALAVIAASAAAGLGAFALMPERAQSVFPDWTLQLLAYLAVGAPALIPIATSFKQKAKRDGAS